MSESGRKHTFEMRCGDRTVVSTSGWTSYLLGVGTVVVLGFGLYTIGKNTPSAFESLKGFVKRS